MIYYSFGNSNVNIEEIIRDPLYQLNLMLWLLKTLPNYPLRPVLKEAGYELLVIEPTMPLSPELRDTVRTIPIECSQQPEPDLLISKDNMKEFVILECKSQLFGIESSSAKQARGLLLQTGEQFKLVTNLEMDANPIVYLLYVTDHNSASKYLHSLCEIKSELDKLNLPTAPVGGVGIKIKGNQICLCDAYDFGEIPSSIKRIIGEEVEIYELDENNVPIPLFYIPWYPGASQSDAMKHYSEKAFGERILTAFITKIGRSSVPANIEIEYEILLNEATFGFYGLWRSREKRKALENSCKDLISKVLKGVSDQFRKKTLSQPRKGFSLNIDTMEIKNAIIDSVDKFSSLEWIENKTEPTLFPMEDDIPF